MTSDEQFVEWSDSHPPILRVGSELQYAYAQRLAAWDAAYHARDDDIAQLIKERNGFRDDLEATQRELDRCRGHKPTKGRWE